MTGPLNAEGDEEHQLPKECPTCGQYTRGCRDCGAEYDEDGGCGSCIGLLPHREQEVPAR